MSVTSANYTYTLHPAATQTAKSLIESEMSLLIYVVGISS